MCRAHKARLGILVFCFLTWEQGAAQTSATAKDPAPDLSTRRELTDEEVQEQFFKKKPQSTAPVTVYLPFFYEKFERALGRVRARVLNPNQSPVNLEVDAKAVVAILEELVIESWLKKLEPIKSKCGRGGESNDPCWLSITAFEDPDVQINFDERALELRAFVPAELRPTRESSLLSRLGSDALASPTDSPSWFSSYLNLNINQNVRSGESQDYGGRDPLSGYVNSGSRLGRVVLDANGRYLEQRESNSAKEFVREDVRAVVDFPNSALRTQVGDLQYPVDGFQIYRPMAGAAVFSSFSLSPSRLTRPTGRYELYLQRPSKVTVYVNEQIAQVIDLPAGRHNLRDFPFAGGLNDLRLEIVDDLGRVEEQRFSYFSNNELLRPGLSDLSYAVGVPWDEIDGERKYNSKLFTYSLSHRIGVTERFTIGANYQADRERSVGGLEGLLSTSIGLFSLEPAFSTRKDSSSGWGARLRYVLQSMQGKLKLNRLTSIEASLFSNHFSQLSAADPETNPRSYKILFNHSQAMNKKLSLSLSVSYESRRETSLPAENLYQISAAVNRRWTNGLTTNLGLRHVRNVGGKEEVGILGFVVWSLPEEKQTVTASHDANAKTTRADWTYQPSIGVGGYSAQLTAQSRSDNKSYGGSIDYTGNRGRLSASHQVDVPERADETGARKSVHTTRLNLGTALVFAGGHFALSRPVTDSFALFSPLKNLEGQNVQVNPLQDGSFVAQTDWLGPAVLPELPSYNLTTVKLNQLNLKQGVALPRDNFTLYPSYRSGYSILIGSEATVYLSTQLLNENGLPAAMLAGQAHYLDKEGVEPVTVFTNRSGLLRSEGFRPGRYRLEIIEGGSYMPVEFEIPDTANEIFDLKPIRLTPKPLEE